MLYAAVTLFLTGVIFSTQLARNFDDPKFFLLRLLTAAGLIFLVLAWQKRKSVILPVTPFWIFLAAWFFFLWESGTVHRLSGLGQSKFSEAIVWFLFFTVTFLLTSVRGREPLALTLAEGLGIPLMVYGWIQHFGWDPVQWNPGGKRIFSLTGNADQLAAVLGVLIAFSSVRWILKPNGFRLALIASESVCLFWTYTRGPLPALIISGILMIALTLISPPFRYLRRRTILFSGSVLAGLFICFALAHGHSMFSRYALRNWRNDPNIRGRLFLMKKGVELIALHPWAGVGPGRFSFAYLPLRFDNPSFYRERIAFPESTHNAFLDCAVELGLPAAAAFLLLWIYSMVLSFRNGSSGLPFFISLTVLFLCLQSIFPEPTLEIMSAFFAAVPAALFSRKKEMPASSGFLIFLGACAVGLFIVTLTLTGKQFTASRWAHQGQTAMGKSDWNAAVSDFTAAAVLSPGNPLYLQTLGKAYEMELRPAPALFNYDAAVNLEADNPYLWADIGRLASVYRWKNWALSAYAKAVSLDPYNPILYHDAAVSARSFNARGLASYYERQGAEIENLDY